MTLMHDDVDGSPADETVRFGLDGVDYEIDLSDQHAAQLRRSLATFVSAARPTGGRSGWRSPATNGSVRTLTTGVDPSAVRAWAASNRIRVAPRGRIPTSVIEQFRAAGN